MQEHDYCNNGSLGATNEMSTMGVQFLPPYLKPKSPRAFQTISQAAFISDIILKI